MEADNWINFWNITVLARTTDDIDRLVKETSDVRLYPINFKGLPLSRSRHPATATNKVKQMRTLKGHRKDEPRTSKMNYDVRQTVPLEIRTPARHH
jgi:hypothetical protein